LGIDGGLLVDETMRTSIENIFACGDVCTAGWTLAEHWFQVGEGFLEDDWKI
jgi:small subunit ribosomal protein S18b